MITKILCALFLLTVFSIADVKDMLLNYDFERIRLTNAARSKVVDLVKQKDFDSVPKERAIRKNWHQTHETQNRV